MRARGQRPSAAPPTWSRAKMLRLLIGAAAVVVLLAVGVVAAVVDVVTGTHHTPTAHRAGSSTPADVSADDATTVNGDTASDHGGAVGQARTAAGDGTSAAGEASQAASGAASDAAAVSTPAEDAISDAAMPEVGDEASHPAPVSLTDPGAPIILPAAHGTGPAGVPSGFPQTPAGAMAQLAAIDAAVLQAGSLSVARGVAAGWVAPGGPSTTSWSTLQALAQLFTSAGLSGGGSPRLSVTLTPLMGQIKGQVGGQDGGVAGPTFVVPCVDFELDATLANSDRGAVADCQRMVWSAGRWVIGPGPEPAAAPAVWPDTDTAIGVGYKDLRRG